ncbi:AbiJ-NTD4 domain-containing protein [Flagellimonas hadalis]|uniref:HEPN AbiJ-N-terminal domain-containing protein n=1 Tax=Flagellimonas hadalis TaxID=2597517 RepID=A0A5N5ISX1_9FLAO|nr:hypothetical protein [Allomuricauda hadalis]KAB5488908.1 hypothetical protein FOT42_009870 [Allomuricauda hadalis]
MGFAERYGHKLPRESLQLDSIDKKLRIKIWNAIDRHFFSILKPGLYNRYSYYWEICQLIWTEILERDIDDIHPFESSWGVNFFEDVKSIYNTMQWFEVYDFIENLSRLDQLYFEGKFAENINYILEEEHSGYRLVDDCILKITNEKEIDAIEEAIKSDESGQISTHLSSALNLLSIKNPDYRNSIKESISAVEAACSIIAGKPKATLGEALKILERDYNLHPALKNSFNALYGYTSDAGGIRHNLKDGEEELEHGDAIFMLVSCSSFINYLQFKFKN